MEYLRFNASFDEVGNADRRWKLHLDKTIQWAHRHEKQAGLATSCSMSSFRDFTIRADWR